MRISNWSSDVCSSDLNELCVVRSAAERGTPAPIDTGEKDMPPVRSADERTMLTEMLDWYRDRVVDKVSDLAQHRAIARPMRSGSNRSEERRVGKSVSVRVELGGRLSNKKKKKI